MISALFGLESDSTGSQSQAINFTVEISAICCVFLVVRAKWHK